MQKREGLCRWRRHFVPPQEGEEHSVHTTSSVKQPVSSLDGIVYGVGAGGIVDLPQTEADLGHLVAIVQRDIGCVDSHCCEEVAVRERETCRGRSRSGDASSDRRKKKVSEKNRRCEGADSINTRTAIAPSNHVLTADLQVTTNFPGVRRLYTPAWRLMDTTLRLQPEDWVGSQTVYPGWRCICCHLSLLRCIL